MKEIKWFNSKNYIWVALGVALLLTLWIQIPRILDPYALEEDLRTMYWVHRYQEPNLFPTVPFDELGVLDFQIGSWTFVNETSAPGYSLMFQIVSYVIPPILFSKVLAFPLMLLSVFYLFRIGERLSGRGTALALSLAFIVLISASTSEISVLPGLHRSFAIPLTLALLYYLMIGRHRLALLVLLINGVIYSPIFPVLVMTYCFFYIRLRGDNRWHLTIQWRPIAELVFVVLIVIVAISPTLVAQFGKTENLVNSTATDDLHLIEDPQFQEGGRSPLFVVFPFIGRGGLTSAGQDALHLLILFLFVLMVLLLRRSETTQPPPALVKLLYASLLGYCLSWLAILLTSSFLLYLPSRHSRVGLFLFMLIFVAINLQETLRSGVRWILQKRTQLIWYLLPIALIALGFAFFLPSNEQSVQFNFRGPVASGLLIGLTLLLFVLTILVRRRRASEPEAAPEKSVALPSKLNWLILGGVVFVGSIFYVRFMLPEFYSPTADSLHLFKFVGTLPEDTVFAGSPCSLSSIPFYGKRAVLFSCERYFQKPQMILDELRALYAANGEEIYSFCQEYGVTHFVVDEKTLTQEYVAQGDYFFEPYNSILAPELQSRTDFALNHIHKEKKLYANGPIFVISCDASLAELTVNG